MTKKYYLLDLSGANHEPNYKQKLISAARSVVEKGDTVVEIGAGYGVCSVWMAREVGTSGKVHSYEAAANQVAVTKDALVLNGDIIEEDLTQRVSVNHGLVGSDLVVYGSQQGANKIEVTDLPDCDVVVTDCEGAELDILRNIEVRPRTFVIETHPDLGAKTEDLESMLGNYGYQCWKVHVADTEQGPKHILIGETAKD